MYIWKKTYYGKRNRFLNSKVKWPLSMDEIKKNTGKMTTIIQL
jgi:hypothetical protein